MENNVKIAFSFFSKLLDEWTVETLWAETIDSENGLYKLENIPFYAPVSCDDIIYAEFDQDEQRLLYKHTVEHSGNSTIQIVILDEKQNANELRDYFKRLGCESEKFDDGYFVLEIPKHINYEPIRNRLEELEANKLITYAEPNLSKNHWY